jgi:hypothetical protein
VCDDFQFLNVTDSKICFNVEHFPEAKWRHSVELQTFPGKSLVVHEVHDIIHCLTYYNTATGNSESLCPPTASQQLTFIAAAHTRTNHKPSFLLRPTVASSQGVAVLLQSYILMDTNKILQLLNVENVTKTALC